MPELPGATVLVIGAGPAGLAAAASLKALGVPFDLVDAQDHVGGVWNVANEDAPSWPTKRLTSSKEHTQFEDLRMPVSFPAFPTTDDYATYLRAYAAHHGLTDHFEPNTSVRFMQSFGQGQWEVTFSNGEVRPYAFVIAAHGVSTRPFLPPLFVEAREAGLDVMHEKTFPGGELVRAKHTLVVGSGQSAADIAVELANAGRLVTMLVSEGHWVVPRTVGPFAADSLAQLEPRFLGKAMNEALAHKVVDKLVGRPEDAGLPAPTESILRDDVIVSDSFLSRVSSGEITVLRSTDRVPLESFDLAVFATGYEPGADYLDPSLSEDLFLGAFPRSRPDLAVLGQVRVVGGVTPILVEQADVAAYAAREFLAGLDTDSVTPSLAAFESLKQRPENRVAKSARTSASTGRGVRGKLGAVISRVSVAAHASHHGPSGAAIDEGLAEDQPITLPLSDRGDLLARLRTARRIFEK